MTLRLSRSFFIFLCVLSLSSTATQAEEYRPAPTILPHTTLNMKTPGYWISRHPSPDKIVFTPDEISHVNNTIRDDLKLTKDIMQIPAAVSGKELKAELEKTVADIQQKNFYNAAGVVAPAEFYESIKKAMRLTAVPDEVKVQYGFTVHFSDQRFFPISGGLYEKKGDIDFDELQNSDLDIATPVVILHKSADGQWYYVKTDISDGWVRAKNIAACPLEELKAFGAKTDWAVVIKAKSDIFKDLKATKYYGYVRMGTRLPIKEMLEAGAVEVRLPNRQADGTLVWTSGYLAATDMHEGFLSYTPRNAIQQAFALLNQPYGWGGMNGEQDCSRFLHEIFSTFGIDLPRNSKEQAQAGKFLAAFSDTASDDEKIKMLKGQAVGGLTLLGMKGHILLFLGFEGGRPYAIHATWGYRQPGANGEDHVCVVNRVIVSDLSLGEGSKKGSLLHRIHSAVLIGP